MALPKIILTQLKEQDLTGYDITKKFSQNEGFYWKASHQQVYRELAKLEETKEVKFYTHPQTSKPDKKIYFITDKGQERLKEWTKEELNHLTIRDEQCSKLMSCLYGGIPEYKANLYKLHSKTQITLCDLEALIETSYKNPKKLDQSAKLARLTIVKRIYMLKAWTEWAEETLEELNQMLD